MPVSCAGSGCPNWLSMPEDLSGYSSAVQCFGHASFMGCGMTAMMALPFVVKPLDLLGDAGVEAAEAGGASRGVWKLPNFARGVAIERLLGHNVPGAFPTLDTWDTATGTATSIKSLDLAAKTYQNTATLSRTLNGYVRSVASFNGADWGKLSISASQIQARALTVAIPGLASEAQYMAMYGAYEYGVQQGVTVQYLVVAGG
jgi:filamentous hemagglutinin